MDKYTATEMAFKHGYEKGYEAGIAKEKKAYCDGLLDGRRAALECIPVAKWIPVSERLPEKWQETGEEWFGEPIEFIVLIAGAKCATTLYFDGADFFDMTTGAIYEVSHWMPLPEPPKEC